MYQVAQKEKKQEKKQNKIKKLKKGIDKEEKVW